MFGEPPVKRKSSNKQIFLGAAFFLLLGMDGESERGERPVFAEWERAGEESRGEPRRGSRQRRRNNSPLHDNSISTRSLPAILSAQPRAETYRAAPHSALFQWACLGSTLEGGGGLWSRGMRVTGVIEVLVTAPKRPLLQFVALQRWV